MDSTVIAGEFHGKKDISEEMGRNSATEVQMEHGWHLDNFYDQANTKSLADQLGMHLLVHKGPYILGIFRWPHNGGGQDDKEQRLDNSEIWA